MPPELSLMLTRSAAARALLTNQSTRHNENLIEDVLLEIFDAYRRLHELEPEYEMAWNSRDGWFKLAHVCPHWRRVVFSSSSRLQLRLLCTPWRSSLAPVLRHLPCFPISFDYRTASWDKDKDVDLALAAIGNRSRVRTISFRRPCPQRLLEALSHSFPELESFKTESGFANYQPVQEFLFLSGSAPSLRRLTLQYVELEHLSPLLSSATSLEELALKLWVSYETPKTLLIAILQRLSCLRRLDLDFDMFYLYYGVDPVPRDPSLHASAEAVDLDVVPLPRLTDFLFRGDGRHLQMLTTMLAAPSLQHFDAMYYSGDDTFPLPQLCKFISESECQFKALHLDLSKSYIALSAETCFKSDHAQPFRIPVLKPIHWEFFSHMLSGPLSTVEELVVTFSSDVPEFRQIRYQHINWRPLLNHLPQVKTIQAHYRVAHGLTHAFRVLHPDGQEPAPNLLPYLDRVEVHFPHTLSESRRREFLGIFESLITARQQVGRPIIVNHSTYSVIMTGGAKDFESLE